MILTNVNTTRMEMMRLKKQLEVARRGHKLLKDKQDEMIRQFMLIIKKTRLLRIQTEKSLIGSMNQFQKAQTKMTASALEEALLIPSNLAKIEVGSKNIMNVIVPKVSPLIQKKIELTYGFAFTPADLDQSILDLSELLPALIELAQLEKTCDMLADEIEKTRRRVNAIEYVKIPNLVDTIHFIVMKLEDYERSSIVRLMKSKEIILAKNLKNAKVSVTK